MLVGAKLRSGCLKKLTAGQFPAACREAGALENLLNHAIEQTRDLAHGLNPVKLTPAGLAPALQELADTAGGTRGPRMVCRCPKPVRVPDEQVATHLFRIAQEAVQNALKHARARTISIAFGRSGRRLVLTVKDDGVGIKPSRRSTGLGLNNMETRARLIGGRLKIQRRRRGTVVACELPLPLKKGS